MGSVRKFIGILIAFGGAMLGLTALIGFTVDGE